MHRYEMLDHSSWGSKWLDYQTGKTFEIFRAEHGRAYDEVIMDLEEAMMEDED